jgi:tetratricopeptide (TPR) repeat protein
VVADRGHNREAEEYLVKARGIIRETFGQESVQHAYITEKLAAHQEVRGDLPRAEASFDTARRLLEKFHGTDHPSVGVCWISLARILIKRGKAAKALPLARRAVALRRDLMPPGHPSVAAARLIEASALAALNRWVRAEEALQEAWSVYERTHGPESPAVATCLSNLGELYNRRGFYEEAERLARRALDIFREVYGIRHPEIAQTLRNLWAALDAQDKTAAAQEALRQAEEIEPVPARRM